jgi:xanthine dehydrogenase accessory factor
VNQELDLWLFVAKRLERDERVMLLVVATSTGSSPGRQGYKMAVASDGQLFGTIGGGMMEVKLVEQSREMLRSASHLSDGAFVRDQVHRKNVPDASGMICSGKQTVIFRLLDSDDATAVDSIIGALRKGQNGTFSLTRNRIEVLTPDNKARAAFKFEKISDEEFIYEEALGLKNKLVVIGGGHCALALSELMAKMDFQISIFDDRPELNTLEKNRFAHDITIIDSYERIADHIESDPNGYVVVMTLGYATDMIVISRLLDRDFKYFGVLGSKAKMVTLLRELTNEGFPPDKLSRLHTPIGLQINSRTPEEIAVSIAAEIISIKNAES